MLVALAFLYGLFGSTAFSAQIQKEHEQNQRTHDQSVKVHSGVSSIALSDSLDQTLPTLSIQDYLADYLYHNEDLQIQRLRRQQADYDRIIYQDFYQSRFILTPAQDHKSQRLMGSGFGGGQDFYERRANLTGSYQQLLPLGTHLEFKATSFFEKSNPNLGSVDREYSLSLRQPLWKNFGGRRQRSQGWVAELSVQVQDQEVNERQLQSCQEGVNNYIQAYTQQERLSVHKELLALSRRALNVAEKAYKEKLLRRLDILAARADYSRSQSDKNKQESELERAWLKLFSYKNSTSIDSKEFISLVISITKPEAFMEKLGTLKARLDNSFVFNSAVKRLEQSQAGVELAKEQAKPSLDFGLRVGKREGLVQSQAAVVDFEENYVQIFAEFEIPVINHQRSAEVGKALAEKRLQSLNQQRLSKELALKVNAAEVSLRELALHMQTTQERIRLFNLQVEEAFRMISTGRIEFSDYIRYRDQLAFERLHYLDLQNLYWQNQLQLAVLDPDMIHICEERP